MMKQINGYLADSPAPTFVDEVNALNNADKARISPFGF
jgi:hypothetical protein